MTETYRIHCANCPYSFTMAEINSLIDATNQVSDAVSKTLIPGACIKDLVLDPKIFMSKPASLVFDRDMATATIAHEFPIEESAGFTVRNIIQIMDSTSELRALLNILPVPSSNRLIVYTRHVTFRNENVVLFTSTYSTIGSPVLQLPSHPGWVRFELFVGDGHPAAKFRGGDPVQKICEDREKEKEKKKE